MRDDEDCCGAGCTLLVCSYLAPTPKSDVSNVGSHFLSLLWLVTCIATSVQACRSRKKKANTYAAGQEVENGSPTQSTSVRGNGYKANQVLSVTTFEMLPLSRGYNR